MHPNRLLGLVATVVGILQVASVWTAWTGLTPESVLPAFGGAALIAGGAYATVRYETNPMMTEYGPTAAAMMVGFLTWGVGLVLTLTGA